MLLEFEKKRIKDNIEIEEGFLYTTYKHELKPDMNSFDGKDFYYTLISFEDKFFLRTSSL